jgi:hypothetical protein
MLQAKIPDGLHGLFDSHRVVPDQRGVLEGALGRLVIHFAGMFPGPGDHGLLHSLQAGLRSGIFGVQLQHRAIVKPGAIFWRLVDSALPFSPGGVRQVPLHGHLALERFRRLLRFRRLDHDRIGRLQWQGQVELIFAFDLGPAEALDTLLFRLPSGRLGIPLRCHHDRQCQN